MADWNIKPRATRCTVCNVPFTPGTIGHSLLDLSEDGYQRRDLCDSCFKALPHVVGQAPSGAWCFTIPNPTTHKTKDEPLQKETAEHLLRVLSERGDPSDQSVIYVLAILLERSKQFVERNVTITPEGSHLRHYEQRSTGDLFTITDPHLTPEDLPAVQQRIIDYLEGPIQAYSATHAKVYRMKRHRCFPHHRVSRKYRI